MRVVLKTVVWVAVLGGVGALGFVLWRGSYEPLEAGAVFGTEGVDYHHTVVETAEPHPTYGRLVAYEEGREVALYFTLRNAGAFGVTVTELDLPPEDRPFLLRPVEARMGRDLGRLSPDDTVAFEAFSLAPGEERLILVRWRFDDCERFGPGTSFTVGGSQVVRFRVLGGGGEQRLTLPGAVTVPAPSEQECPRPPD